VYNIEHNNNNNNNNDDIVHPNGRFARLTFCRGAVTRNSMNTLTRGVGDKIIKCVYDR